MKIYVASSWRNIFHGDVVRALRADGHEVYDFKDSEGFSWKEIDKDWNAWNPQEYLEALDHPLAQRGFARDMQALKDCEICVYVMPCGVSASMEMGYAVGAGKKAFVYVPHLADPDLMVKMAELVTDDLSLIRQALLT